jgi:hypothetical protein
MIRGVADTVRKAELKNLFKRVIGGIVVKQRRTRAMFDR